MEWEEFHELEDQEESKAVAVCSIHLVHVLQLITSKDPDAVCNVMSL